MASAPLPEAAPDHHYAPYITFLDPELIVKNLSK